MIKLNNKGMTTVEVIICFLLVVIITTSMFVSISAFNEKRILEGYKQEITTYKNLLTKDIQDDFIKIGLTHASYEKEVSGTRSVHTITATLKDGTKRQLVIIQDFALSSYHIGGSTTTDDYYMIKYGKPTDLVEYPIPNIGSYKNEYNHTVKDLSINNVLISIDDDNIISIYIGFYHPELTTRYAISIVCPMNYVSNGGEGTTAWEY